MSWRQANWRKAYFAGSVRQNMSSKPCQENRFSASYSVYFLILPFTPLTMSTEWWHNYIYRHCSRGCMMARSKRANPKVDSLRQEGSLNPHPERVADPLFASSDFFDERDLVQVKYEMVRRVRADGQAVSQAAAAFGLSRPSFYQAQAALDGEGLPGLLPKKRGPRTAHKLGVAVMDFLGALLAREPDLGSADLARRVRQQFGIEVHPRSVERALARKEKKRS